MGAPSHPNFKLMVAPVSHPGLAGLWFRRQLTRWWAGPPGVIIARDKRRLLAAIGTHGKRGHRIVLETHGLESLLSPDQAGCRTVETRCLSVADGLVANCGGTLNAWQDAHTVDQPAWVSHNATHLSPLSDTEPREVALILGSMRENKGVAALLTAARDRPFKLEWVGGTPSERRNHPRIDGLSLLPPVSHSAIHDTLARARVLIAPLGDNIFSRQLTSPLKLWDYLATDKPIVTARTPATEEIAAHSDTAFHFYQPDNIPSIHAAITRAWHAPRRTPFIRNWDKRAAELESVFEHSVGDERRHA
jgi:glycosyltransferase involved in cell wall biosynthesis